MAATATAAAEDLGPNSALGEHGSDHTVTGDLVVVSDCTDGEL